MKKKTMRSFLLFIFIAYTVLFTASCFVKCKPSQIRDAVMKEGMTISVRTQHGDLTIKAGYGCEREYIWDGISYTTELVPRTKPWYGTYGLLSKPYLNPPFPDVIIMNTEEAIFDYNSYDHFYKYHEKNDPEVYEVYNDEGMLIRFIKRVSQSDRVAIDILVGQIRINGKLPKKLNGSRNSEISVVYQQ